MSTHELQDVLKSVRVLQHRLWSVYTGAILQIVLCLFYCHSHVPLHRYVWFGSGMGFLFGGVWAVVIFFPLQTAFSIQTWNLALHLIITHYVVVLLHMHWYMQVFKWHLWDFGLNTIHFHENFGTSKLETLWNCKYFKQKPMHSRFTMLSRKAEKLGFSGPPISRFSRRVTCTLPH